MKTTTTLGDANHDGYHEAIYSYGAHSFSIWNAQGKLVFDSSEMIARITADVLGLDLENKTGFNRGDSRSDDKGAEPESVVVGYVEGKNYAFVGLERTGGVWYLILLTRKWSTLFFISTKVQTMFLLKD